MGAYLTKSFFKKKLKEFLNVGAEYLEVGPGPDCCPKCEAKANKLIAISTATKDDYPPFHKQCRCSILPRTADQQAGFLKELKEKYATGAYPMKRCPHCSEWIEGNSLSCNRCGKKL
ncbi:MAG: hypothetical protein M0R70_05675 [Nitrospirae bacterium]|nr:hypothetical protein [Nitrospirota bacterium]